MQSGNRKDVIFLSNFCEYSNEILNLIVKKNAKPDFVVICVDNNRYQLPNFVDKVPLIYTKNDEIVYDDSIIKYLEMLYPTETEEIMPWSIQQPSNYSNQFSFLLDDSADLQNKGYTILGYDQRISTTIEDSDTSKKGKFDSSQMDKYMQERENDEQNFKRNMNGDGTQNLFRR